MVLKSELDVNAIGEPTLAARARRAKRFQPRSERRGPGRTRWNIAVFLPLVMASIAFYGGRADAAALAVSGQAYGTYAFVGTTVTSAITASASRGCLNPPGVSSASAASVSHLPLFSTGAINDQVTTTANSAQADSTVNGVSMLGGLITANAINAVSIATQGGSFSVSSAGTMFTDLMVNGVAIASNVAKNTTIALPGIGKVVVNEQFSTVNASSAALTVNMIHVFVTTVNVLAIPVGTEVTVATAKTRLTLAFSSALFSGGGYGSSVSGGVQSAPTALALLPCVGTNGTTVTVNLVGFTLPSTLNTGAISDTAEGNETASLISGHTTASIAKVNLLSGLVRVASLKVQANVSSPTGGSVSLTDTGTAFTSLVVLGHPEILDTVPANTHLTLPGIGTLYLRREIVVGHSIDVRGVEIVLIAGNTLGLPAEDIIVGRATIGLIP